MLYSGKKGYDAFIARVIREEKIYKIGGLPDCIQQIIKCYACTNYGVCCGVLSNDRVVGSKFM